MVVLEMVGEVIAFPGGLIKELDIHYVVRILVCHFNDSSMLYAIK